MTIDYTKTATPCQLIAALIPALQGQLWLRHFNSRWQARQRDGSWTAGQQGSRHLVVVHEAIEALPAEPRWNRFKDRFLFNEGLRQILRWLKQAWEAGVLARPEDWPFESTWTPRMTHRCLCGKGCWDMLPLIPARSEATPV